MARRFRSKFGELILEQKKVAPFGPKSIGRIVDAIEDELSEGDEPVGLAELRQALIQEMCWVIEQSRLNSAIALESERRVMQKMRVLESRIAALE